MMKANSILQAWQMADRIFPTNYIKDEAASLRAGYDIYRSTVPGVNAWISDLGSRLEINTADGKSQNIWIDETPRFSEYAIAVALQVLNDAIYHIDDLVPARLQEATGIDKARAQLYGAYDKIAQILREQYPESRLLKIYNLQEQ